MIIQNKLYLEKSRGSNILIGDNFTFMSGDCFNPLSRNILGCLYTQYPESEIIIGDNTGFSSVCIWCKTRVFIGNNVKIGADSLLMDTDAHNLNFTVRSSGEKNMQGRLIDSSSANASPITICDDVLIGTRCIVLKGVTIGARTVIGSGSVVTKDIPEDCIAAGNPCRVIRKF